MSIVRQTSTNNLTTNCRYLLNGSRKVILRVAITKMYLPHFGPFAISFSQILVIESTVRVERKAFHDKKNFHIENISKPSERVTASLSSRAM